MTLRLRLGLAPILAAAFAACSPHVEGNGVYAERVFDAGQVAPFDRAAIGLPPDVDGEPLKASIFANDQPRQVVLSGDENIIQHIEVKVDGGGTLRTSTDLGSYTAVHPPQLRVQAPELVAVEAIGGAAVTVLGAAAPTFTATSSAKGHVSLSGAGGTTLLADLSGGAVLDASGYPVTSAQLVLTGASRATVWSAGQVTGSATEASAILVKGVAPCEVVLTGGSTCGPLP